MVRNFDGKKTLGNGILKIGKKNFDKYKSTALNSVN